jgi:CubicO group peptidase (beta-lactamase class C family)
MNDLPRFRAWVLLIGLAVGARVLTAPPVEMTPTERREAVRRLEPDLVAMFREHAVSNHFPGIAFGVVVDGELVVSGGHGYSDLATQTPATPKTRFRIASMTKSLTAMAVLQLRDQGRLQLEVPAARYLPELRRVKYPTADSPVITLRHLLTHGAGFPEDNPWGDRQLADTDAELIELVRQGVAFSNPPEIAYEYSNLGFALLGRVVGVVSRQRYQRYVDQHVLRPLGMTDTVWDYSRTPAERQARGYRWEEDQWKPEVPLGDGAYASMGGLISSVEDFARYMAFHLDAWPPRNGSDTGPLKRSSRREMHRPSGIATVTPDAKKGDGTLCPTASAYGYGLGWSETCDHVIRVGHSGGLPGYGSNWRMLPDYGLAVVSLANRTYANAGAVNSRVLDHILETTGFAPRPHDASAALQLRKLQLEKVLPAWREVDTAGIFAENFFPDRPRHLWQAETARHFAALGLVRKVGWIQAENRLRGTFVMEGEGGDLEVFFTLTPENPPLIQELKMKLIPHP